MLLGCYDELESLGMQHRYQKTYTISFVSSGNLNIMPGLIKDISAHLEISFMDGLPTLMPRWEELERSELPEPLSNETSPQVGVPPFRTLVVIHAFYPDRLESLLVKLKENKSLHDLIITTESSEKAKQVKEIHSNVMGKCGSLEIEVYENHGRDLLPFWRVLQAHGARYDVFLKLHLKRSSHIEALGSYSRVNSGSDAGMEWSEDCFRCLIPSCQSEVEEMIAWMRRLNLAALYPRPHELVSSIGWGDAQNFKLAASILREFGVSDLCLLMPLLFPAGNMYWGRMTHFLPLTPYFLDSIHYPEEPIPIDGTFLHASERALTFLFASRGASLGILFPPDSEVLPSRIRTLAIDLKSYSFDTARLGDVHESPAFRLHSFYINAALQARKQTLRSKKKLDDLQCQLELISRSPLRRLLALLRRG
jgi:hypothetical protein